MSNPLLYNLREGPGIDGYIVSARKTYTGEVIIQIVAQTKEFALERADVFLRKYAKEHGFSGIRLEDSLF